MAKKPPSKPSCPLPKVSPALEECAKREVERNNRAIQDAIKYGIIELLRQHGVEAFAVTVMSPDQFGAFNGSLLFAIKPSALGKLPELNQPPNADAA